LERRDFILIDLFDRGDGVRHRNLLATGLRSRYSANESNRPRSGTRGSVAPTALPHWLRLLKITELQAAFGWLLGVRQARASATEWPAVAETDRSLPAVATRRPLRSSLICPPRQPHTPVLIIRAQTSREQAGSARTLSVVAFEHQRY